MFNKKKMEAAVLSRRLLAAPLVAALTVVGCAAPQAKDDEPDASSKAVEIKVLFDGDCPRAVNNFVPEASGAARQQVFWQAADMAGAPVEKNFEVYFDPFNGQPIRSNGKGRTNPRNVDRDAPRNVLYKYTIVGEGCEGQPLDPFIRLH